MSGRARPLIFGELLYDRFPDGSEILGGAPFNVAWNLRGLGQDPLLISRVGRDELGDRILAAMRGFALDTRGIQRDPDHATGTVDVTLVGGEPRFEIVKDRAWDFIAPPQPDDGEKSYDLFYHGSLALRAEDSARTAEKMLANARRESTPVFFDVNLRSPWWDSAQIRQRMETAKYIKLNEDELKALATDSVEIETQAHELMEHSGARAVFVTEGARGATAVTADGRCIRTRAETEVAVVDTVGAGDAFSSVLIAGILKHWPLESSLHRARQFAEAVVGLRGATTTESSFYARICASWSLV